jgi:predicted dehydrogenase
MNYRPSRRRLLKTAAFGLGAAAASRLLPIPSVFAANITDKKLRVALIGCGVQGVDVLMRSAMYERLVAIVDPDEGRHGSAMKKAASLSSSFDTASVRVFKDYRKLFDAMAKDLDAVLIATPNHHHALPAMMAMKLGIATFVEKPMAHTLHETRLLADYARQYKVATQMGNQGHSGDGYRRLCEYIWAGAIGKITEVHAWSDHANGGQGSRPPAVAVPHELSWDDWIGPAPYRDYHPRLHPHTWHGWYDFGNGSLGNMGSHLLDGAQWALKLERSIAIEVEEITGGSDEQYPIGARIRWDYPARGDMPPVKIFWHEGLKSGVTKYKLSTWQGVNIEACNRPPIVKELEKKYGRRLGTNGTLYIGDKGILWNELYGWEAQIIPAEQMRATPRPPQSLPRFKGAHCLQFFRAIRDGKPAPSNFEEASRLTEMILLGGLAIRAGVNQKVEWDTDALKCTNRPELNQYVRQTYRKGWEV